MTRVLVIQPDSRVAEVREVEETLEAFQALVGGNLEGITLGPGLAVYLNEDGKSLDLPRNKWGEAFIIAVLAAVGRTLMPGDYIVGPVVIFGGYDHEGENVDVNESVIALAREVGVEVKQ